MGLVHAMRSNGPLPQVCNPHPPFINYSFSRRTGPGENEVRNPTPPSVY